jgi:hypothetical protein
MVSRLGLILFTALFLFGCVSYNKDINKIGIEESKKTIADKKNESSIENLHDLEEALLKIHNQKEAVEFLGEPAEKIISILEWNIEGKPYYEYVENWKWEKPAKHYLLFNKEGKIHNKIQQAVMTGNFNNKDLNNFKAISSDKWLNN